MRLFDNGTNLFLRHLLNAGDRALGEHPAGRADLDEVGTVFDVLADLLFQLPGAVRDPFADRLCLGRQEVVVRAMPARAAQRDGGGKDPGALDLAAIDRVPHGDDLITARADIAHRGEPHL